jgi:FtsZ-binding cell division protein ZapB
VECILGAGQDDLSSELDLEQVHSLQQTIEVNKRRIGYLTNENQKLRKENSEWRELCQELMTIIEGK